MLSPFSFAFHPLGTVISPVELYLSQNPARESRGVEGDARRKARGNGRGLEERAWLFPLSATIAVYRHSGADSKAESMTDTLARRLRVVAEKQGEVWYGTL